MDSQDTAESDTIFDKRVEAKALPLPLLKRITGDFSDGLEIGRGGFAVVYKGLLENGVIAVKKLSEASDIDERKFLGEVDCLMKAKHKNIVQFLGYCSDTQGQYMEHNGTSVMVEVRHRLLCFEYLPNGSLDKYIKDSSREWRKCYQIIKGVCEGLHYLHKERRIVHSDLKPANILLDNDMVPKIADFGISRCFDEKQTHTVTKNITGSMGYLSPEVLYGKISFKSDIFSLGVIIIELLTSEKGYPDVKDVIQYWAHKVEKSQEERQLEQIRVCTEVGQSCLEYHPGRRPSAQEIIEILKQTERKEPCIETGASSSTALRASSHVEEDKIKIIEEDKIKIKNKNRNNSNGSMLHLIAAQHALRRSNRSKAIEGLPDTLRNKSNNSTVPRAPSPLGQVPDKLTTDMMQFQVEDKSKSSGSTSTVPRASSHEDGHHESSHAGEDKNKSSNSTVRRASPSAGADLGIESIGFNFIRRWGH